MGKKNKTSAVFTENEILIFENNFDEILEKTGCFNARSIAIFVTMYIVIMFGAMHIGGVVFLAAKMDHQCIVDSGTMDLVSEKCHINWTETETMKSSPVVKNKTSKCTRFTNEYLLNMSCSSWSSSSPLPPSGHIEPCEAWSYDQSVFQSTIISDFNLVCSNTWKTNVSQMLLMFGVLIGALVVGICSDRFGRRPLFIICLLALLVSAILSSIVKDYWLFSVVRMVVGLASIGLCVSGYVYAMEIMVEKYRVLFGQAIHATFSFGFMFFALFGYLERRWVFLNYIIAVPLALLLVIYLCVSAESPRWLVSKKRSHEGLNVFRQLTKKDDHILKNVLKVLEKNTTPILKKSSPSVPYNDSGEVIVEGNESGNTVTIFRNPVLRKISFIFFYNWFAVTCIYYGLTLNTSSLAGDPFLNFFLSGLVEIPANFGAVLLIKLWGRRPTVCLGNTVCGVALVAMVLVPEGYQAVDTTLYLIGKFCATAIFSTIYLYTVELYPTPLRGNGVGICSGFARIGGLTSLLILMLGQINTTLPYLTFGTIALVAGFLIVLLPETKGTKLPETVKDSEDLYTRRNRTVIQQCLCKNS
uniref:Organic cation transporter protein-like n=1 Tax=Ciona intestinalis TaxID=7719 RepID=F6S271_CIOIN|nr:organic cation transporter protein-like [Ciona intestinalis]|eukprot:XP_026695719.1 organic cation transporter protein-like [Ciona intestinalis]